MMPSWLSDDHISSEKEFFNNRKMIFSTKFFWLKLLESESLTNWEFEKGSKYIPFLIRNLLK